MRILTTIAVALMITASYAQETKGLDDRIIRNEGRDMALHYFKNDPNTYNYKYFQLENFCELVKISEVKSTSINQNEFHNSKAELLSKNAILSEGFNFKEYGITPLDKEVFYIRLEENLFVKVNSVLEVKRAFMKSALNNKTAIVK